MMTVEDNGDGDITPAAQCSNMPTHESLEVDSFLDDYIPLPLDESLSQIINNVLPPYDPSPPPESIADSVEKYSCSECGDTYYSKSSLNFHLQRQSILIRFKCDSCPDVQIFYNRCSFLAHMRAHTECGEVSDISNATVQSLPLSLMEGLLADITQNSEEKESESFFNYQQECNEINNLLKVSISEGNFEPSFLSFASSEKFLAKKIQCSECNLRFATPLEREEHFTNKGKLPSLLLAQCQKCDVICPSECSLKAHKRLHLQISPYVCPECGDNPYRFWDSFQQHLKYQCFHYSRSVIHKCLSCKVNVGSPEQLNKHMVLNHVKTLHKCQKCPIAFINLKNFKSHCLTSHPSDLKLVKDPLPFYRCEVCEATFNKLCQYISHLDIHLKESIHHYAFRCMVCGILDNKIHLRVHLRKSHPEVYKKLYSLPQKFKGNTPKNQPQIGENDAEVFATGRFECLLCHYSFTTQQGHTLHVTKAHGNHKYSCGICSRFSINRLTLVSHGKEHLRQQVSLCLLCQNKQVLPPETLDEHLLGHVKNVKFRTFCPICETLLLNSKEAIQHLRLEHFLNHEGDQRSSNVVSNELTHDTKGIQNDSITGTGPSNETFKMDIAKKIESALTSQSIKEGENSCAICDFTSSNREEFKKHIAAHKKKKSFYQCQSCGLTFVVLPSLKKHLLIAHEIADVDQYLKQEGTNYSPENKTTIIKSSKSSSLECSVCLQAFDTDALLKSHMRSHGMAFIQAKKSLWN